MGLGYRLKKINIYFLLIILLLLCVFMYAINKIYGFTVYPDEFGYWASAAQFIGYDWSSIASLGSYYSFGYSLILIPILFLFKDPVLAYRIAIGVNMLLMCVGVYVLYQFLNKVFGEKNAVQKSFISAAAVLYPVWIFYMQMTLTEGILLFLFILVSYLFTCMIQKPKIFTAVMLAVTLIYMYTVHMRTIGVVIACVIVLGINGIYHPNSRKKIFIFATGILIFAILSIIIKNSVIGSVFSYAGQDMISDNDYAGRMGQIKGLFHLSSIIPFIEGFFGKIFYLGMASFGSFYIATGWCLKKSRQLFYNMHHKNVISQQEWLALFLLLAALGEILICNIAMYRGGVIDSILYGRYDEFVIPIFMVIGLYVMCEHKYAAVYNTVLGLGSGFMVPVILHMITRDHKGGIRGYFMAGMSYLLQEENLNVKEFFLKAWLFGFVWILVVSVVILFCRRTGQYWLMSSILILEIALGLQISDHYTYKVNGCNYTELIIGETINEQITEKDTVCYLNDGSVPYVDYVQMQLGNRTIQLITMEEIENINRSQNDSRQFVITNVSNENKDRLLKIFDKHIITNTYVLYYNMGEDTER